MGLSFGFGHQTTGCSPPVYSGLSPPGPPSPSLLLCLPGCTFSPPSAPSHILSVCWCLVCVSVASCLCVHVCAFSLGFPWHPSPLPWPGEANWSLGPPLRCGPHLTLASGGYFYSWAKRCCGDSGLESCEEDFGGQSMSTRSTSSESEGLGNCTVAPAALASVSRSLPPLPCQEGSC